MAERGEGDSSLAPKLRIVVADVEHDLPERGGMGDPLSGGVADRFKQREVIEAVQIG